MAKNSKDAYGAVGTTSLLSFDPDTLVIVTDPKHPLFDERAKLEPDEAMILNVAAHGVLQPITVRKNPETGETEVVVGRQRVKATREANARRKARGETLLYVPARVTKAEDDKLAAMIVIENELRKDDSPINRARKAQRLRDNHGFGDEQIAVIFGCSVQTVRGMTALLDCTAAVRDAVNTGKVPVTVALKLGKLEPEAQREALVAAVNAGEGKVGHERAKAVRAAAGVKRSPVRGAREIGEMMERVQPGSEAFRVLTWVLGGADTFTVEAIAHARAAAEAPK